MPSTTSGQGSLHRVTVNLTPNAYEALEQGHKLTGDTQTDTINRALQVYAYIEEITRNDGDLYVCDNGSKELERLHIL